MKAMPCAVKDCLFADDPNIWTDPCTTCGKPTHHLCANSVHADEDISQRFCSLACMLNAKDASQPDFPLSLDIPSSLNPPSSLAAYVKMKRVH